ncbi:hypothetical protein SAMN05660706_1622 [Desulfoscipio geothermicus DSM 3669]|uniref:Uncharacterized protein n=1 Tax=Desulfoscipio geothermicus DSM 3669 TaxID=1121426 RepID=A0A1I6ELE8_9FIRM|nr:hypothetical protein SAMN05660706_1622 [Desulfoscipio geothermicus DSM 3669]
MFHKFTGIQGKLLALIFSLIIISVTVVGYFAVSQLYNYGNKMQKTSGITWWPLIKTS